MTFDDADEPMTRDEIEYMLTKSEDTLEARRNRNASRYLSLDELMAREVMVPRTDAFMIDIEDDTQGKYPSHSKAKLLSYPCLRR